MAFGILTAAALSIWRPLSRAPLTVCHVVHATCLGSMFFFFKHGLCDSSFSAPFTEHHFP